jgi:DNA-binding IclR family transcriptional regulator
MDSEKEVFAMSKSLEKVALIFEKFLQSEGSLGVNEIARELSLPKSTISRLLISMQKFGFTRRDPSSQKFFLGIKLFELGCKASEDLELQSIAIPEMERLRDAINESVLLIILEDIHITYLHKVECKHAVVIQHKMGGTAPAYCVASGKAMLAYMPDRLEKTITVGLKAWNSNTITDPERLRRECEKARKLGYATVSEEFREGVSGIAAPIFDQTGAVAASVSVAVPTVRLNRKRQTVLIASVKKAAARISHHMGAMKNAPSG